MTPDPKGPAMTDQSGGLLALAERCEKAEGPDRELDEAIMDAREQWSGDYIWLDYTRSLDAAMTLVPENADAAGERYRLEGYNSPGVLAPHVRASAWVAGAARCYAATPALALCAAALRARAAITLATGAAS